MRRLTILAALAVATIAFTAPADAARRHHQPTAQAGHVTKFCGDRVCPIQAESTAGSYKAPRAAWRAPARRAAAPTPRPKPHEAAEAPQKPRQAETGSGIVRSGKTGAKTSVSPRFAPIAQAIVDDLEQNYGASIRFMGGWRRGPCWSGGLHPCGLAIDFCQIARGIVDPRCKLPSRAVEAKVAAKHGALSGGIWCHQDRGHIQLGNTAGACGSNIYSAVSKFKAKRARYNHHRIRYAWRR